MPNQAFVYYGGRRRIEVGRPSVELVGEEPDARWHRRIAQGLGAFEVRGAAKRDGNDFPRPGE